jgi:RNA polymerase sigma-70 factor (TIGR02957 family)
VSADVFQRHRALLFTVAYDVLGSAAEAEDVVQDAWLRWSAAERDDVRDPKAYLVRVATNLALNRLSSARARREAYVGPWLPEPVLTAPDVADEVEVAEAVSMALLVVLETLSPLERAVFVLHEVFGLSHREVGEAVGRSEATVRQLAHRAREHVEARRPRFVADRRTQRDVTERFLAAVVGGDVEALVRAMAPEVTLLTDGGGVAKAALRPIRGPRKVASYLTTVAADGLTAPDLQFEVLDVNGAPGVAIRANGEVFVVVQVGLDAAGLVESVHVVLNPDKLGGLREPRQVAVR